MPAPFLPLLAPRQPAATRSRYEGRLVATAAAGPTTTPEDAVGASEAAR